MVKHDLNAVAVNCLFSSKCYDEWDKQSSGLKLIGYILRKRNTTWDGRRPGFD